jgi:hypothetical protein
MADDVYLIWSHEHGAWWGPAGNGYARRISEAGRYTERVAIEICTSAMPGTSTRMEALPEVPVRLASLEAMLALCRAEYPGRKEPWE